MKLLIVEDSVPVRECMVEFLTHICNVECLSIAGTLRDGLASMRRDQPDLVILDVHLPDGNSIDAIGRCKQAAPNMRIAMFTSDVSESGRARSLREGADWYFDKFHEFDKVLGVVRGLAAVDG